MKKIIGAACAVFAALLILLTGCPSDTLIETGVGTDVTDMDHRWQTRGSAAHTSPRPQTACRQ